ncbi:MAG: NAD-dependent epimerase/dehydratase family protein [Mycobacterium sp.]|uniref:NAD-dependent epimerase/dehydratase family protein n=1 Tax=Mycobacterium sp. TaxID=1785 RepID=UPI003C713DCB
MRIFLTGVTGLLGRAMARQLIAAGHAVTGIAAYPHHNLHPDVDFVCASLGDPVLEQLAGASDVVLHLTPIEPAVPGSAGINGLVRVAHSAARAGARLIYVSVSAGQPTLYRQAETLVSSGWAPSLVVRIAPPIGRQLDWMICRTIGSLLHGTASAEHLRLLHYDDLIRFLVFAVATDSTGTVDLASPDTTHIAAAQQLLRSVGQRPRLARLPSWPELTPELDLAAAQEAWRFEFGWSANDSVVDTVRGLAGRRLDVRGATDVPEHLPLPVEVGVRTEPLDGTVLRSASPDGLEGEFDDRADPRFPVFSAAPLAQTLPGPLTPMTLDVQLGGLRAAARAMRPVMAGGDVIAEEWGSRAIAVFSHRPYVGVSASVIAAEQLPGWDVDDIVGTSFDGSPVDSLLPMGRPPLTGGLLGPAAKAVVIKRALALLRHLKADTHEYVAAATAEHLDAAQLISLSDAQLQVRIRLLRDRIHQGWGISGRWLIDSAITAATVGRAGLQIAVSGIGALLESDAIAAETSSLAALIRGEEQLCALALERDLDGVSAQSAAIGAAFASAVSRIGHRGPGEVELANLMFRDDPAMLLAAAGRAATDVPQPMSPAGSDAKLSERMAANARASRELAYDTTIRFTHELRMTLRELGSRYVDAELIDVAGEVFYLTCDEAVTIPSDARLRIKRRRAERERFQGQRLSDVITIS